MKKEITFNDENDKNYRCFVDNTFNKGDRYLHLLARSIQRLGLARSVVVDKDDNILCGAKTAALCQELGISRARIIETRGDELIIVKRTDVEPSTTDALEISLTDNLIASKNLKWDVDTVLKKMQERYSFDARKWDGYECVVEELDIEQFLKDEVLRQSKVQKKSIRNIVQNETLSLFD